MPDYVTSKTMHYGTRHITVVWIVYPVSTHMGCFSLWRAWGGELLSCCSFQPGRSPPSSSTVPDALSSWRPLQNSPWVVHIAFPKVPLSHSYNTAYIYISFLMLVWYYCCWHFRIKVKKGGASQTPGGQLFITPGTQAVRHRDRELLQGYEWGFQSSGWILKTPQLSLFPFFQLCDQIR